MLVCNLLCIAAAADGYQIVLNGGSPACPGRSQPWVYYDLVANLAYSGNVIANKGFIRHIGFQNDTGEYYLKAEYTALWGAMQSLGQLLGMIFLNPVSDRIGRKMTLYLLWVLLAAVRFLRLGLSVILD